MQRLTVYDNDLKILNLYYTCSEYCTINDLLAEMKMIDKYYGYARHKLSVCKPRIQ